VNQLIAAVAGVLIVLWASGLATGQTRLQKPPDLEGIWTNATVTPFERPADLAGKAYFTPDEAAAFEKQARGSSHEKSENPGLRPGLSSVAPPALGSGKRPNSVQSHRRLPSSPV
jgi:hypothetical protein